MAARQRFDFAEEGAPRSLRVNVTHWAFNKTATRTTESWWMRFQPRENIFNNLWNTNGTQWYPYVAHDRDWLFRFHLAVTL